MHTVDRSRVMAKYFILGFRVAPESCPRIHFRIRAGTVLSLPTILPLTARPVTKSQKLYSSSPNELEPLHHPGSSFSPLRMLPSNRPSRAFRRSQKAISFSGDRNHDRTSDPRRPTPPGDSATRTRPSQSSCKPIWVRQANSSVETSVLPTPTCAKASPSKSEFPYMDHLLP